MTRGDMARGAGCVAPLTLPFSFRLTDRVARDGARGRQPATLSGSSSSSRIGSKAWKGGGGVACKPLVPALGSEVKLRMGMQMVMGFWVIAAEDAVGTVRDGALAGVAEDAVEGAGAGEDMVESVIGGGSGVGTGTAAAR